LKHPLRTTLPHHTVRRNTRQSWCSPVLGDVVGPSAPLNSGHWAGGTRSGSCKHTHTSRSYQDANNRRTFVGFAHNTHARQVTPQAANTTQSSSPDHKREGQGGRSIAQRFHIKSHTISTQQQARHNDSRTETAQKHYTAFSMTSHTSTLQQSRQQTTEYQNNKQTTFHDIPHLSIPAPNKAQMIQSINSRSTAQFHETQRLNATASHEQELQLSCNSAFSKQQQQCKAFP
jgi:hypothetical protein